MQPIDYRWHARVNSFRKRRARLLRDLIDQISDRVGRPIVILDVGGGPDYWMNLPSLDRIERIDLLNARQTWLDQPLPEGAPEHLFRRRLGDARNLEEYGDKSVDLVHSNSVIEHVGTWSDMKAMADEMIRVGDAGWVQTPAWSFPVEPHFHVPFMHWFGAPMRARMLSLSLAKRFRNMKPMRRRQVVENINLVTKGEFSMLFPESELHVERFALLAKSYCAHWMEPAGPLRTPG